MYMSKDKFSATWVSHSSIGDFLKCPRSYFLKNVYKDLRTNHKIQLVTPALSLGSAVHEVLESLSVLPTEQRFSESLLGKFEKAWKKVSGERGGFTAPEQEQRYFARGRAMIEKVIAHPGPLTRLAVKIKMDLPQFWLSEDDNIILCGKIDWLEYFPETDSVQVIDFKTSTRVEDDNSLQLPIYHLLVHECQHRKVEKASYWYLELSDELVEKPLPDLAQARETVLQIAKKIKLARQLQVMKCPQGSDGCRYCWPLEKIVRGEAKYVGENEYRTDVYILPAEQPELKESVIL